MTSLRCTRCSAVIFGCPETPLLNDSDSNVFFSTNWPIVYPVCLECAESSLHKLESSAQRSAAALSNLNAEIARMESEMVSECGRIPLVDDLLAEIEDLQQQESALQLELDQLQEAERAGIRKRDESRTKELRKWRLLSEIQEDRSARHASIEHGQRELDVVCRRHPLASIFQVKDEYSFYPNVNGCHIGRGPDGPDWAEINAGLGYIVFALSVLHDVLGANSVEVCGAKLVPSGSRSKIEVYSEASKALKAPSSPFPSPNAGSSNGSVSTGPGFVDSPSSPTSPPHSASSNGSSVASRPSSKTSKTVCELCDGQPPMFGAASTKFNRGLVLLLDILSYLMNILSDRGESAGVALPVHDLALDPSKGTINNLPVKLLSGSEEAWTRAMRFLISAIEWSITACIILEEHAEKTAHLTTP